MDPSFIVFFVVLIFMALCLSYSLGKVDGFAKAHRELIETWNRLMNPPPETYHDARSDDD